MPNSLKSTQQSKPSGATPKVLLKAREEASVRTMGKGKPPWDKSWDKGPWDKGHWANRK